MSTEAYIYDAVRTPRGKGKQDGSLHEVRPVKLLADLLDDLKDRHDLDTARVDDVVMGCVTASSDQGSCLPKAALQVSSWDQQVAAVQLNRFCASGLEAVNIAAQKVASGFDQMVVAGGIESMSRVPMMSDGGPWAMDPETNFKSKFVPQGIGADLIAALDGYLREDVDCFAAASHRKAARAWEEGRFAKSVVPVTDNNGLVILDRDEMIKPDTSVEILGGLKPSFKQLGEMGFDAMALSSYPAVDHIPHVHHAGNSSGIADGASAVLIGNEKAGEELGLSPRCRIIMTATTSTDPVIMLTGPAPATRKALANAGLAIDDIDLFEVNEAFASVVMRFMNELQVPAEKVNVNGGAIAMGHPLGATGGMLVGCLIDELERQNLKRGLATLCVGGGMGVATIIERV